MLWHLSHHADPRAIRLADQHYSRRKYALGKKFMPPARQLVLLTMKADALWGTSAPYAHMVNRWYPGAWLCSIFRNGYFDAEGQFHRGEHLSSELIAQAVSATRWIAATRWKEDVPADGFVTLVDGDKTNRKRDPGRCFRKAGWDEVGKSSKGLYILRLSPDEMPEPVAPEPPIAIDGSMQLALGAMSWPEA